MQPQKSKHASSLHGVADALMGTPNAFAPGLSRRFLTTWPPLVVAWGLIAFGGLKIWGNIDSERRGVAGTPKYSASGLPKVIKRSEHAVEFRNLMDAKWLDASFWIAGGLIVRGFVRRQDRLDPMSPSFQGQKSLDDLGQWLDHENDKRHRPLR